MEICNINDVGGDFVLGKYFDGVLFPAKVPGDSKDHVESILNLKCRSDDVLLATFPKSGTNWAYEILYMLVKGKAEYLDRSPILIDFHKNDTFDKWESPRILSTHFFPKHIPKAFKENMSKIIYVYRNPKDTAVSYYTFAKRVRIEERKQYDGTWENFIAMFMDGNGVYNGWWNHVGAWCAFKKQNPDYPILMLSFEDMKKDFPSSVRKLAEYLGTNQDPDFLQEVANKCQFNAMFKEKNNKIPDDVKAMSRDGSNPYYRKGDVGDWKNWLTVAQNDLFDDVNKTKSKNLDLQVMYSI